MLLTFRSPAFSDITMFGDVGLALIERMGHSPTVPGALASEDVPVALERLRRAIAAEGAEPAPSVAGEARNDGEERVSLAHRALPLIQLLEAAAAEDSYVMWDH
ncbi:MAG TPA: DUF1840 domain-containing protein [Thioalkalivibrio sp.]|jgi:hypothetical protein|nr:DUF1840 domain-containing protein [Thioalkalivibrio sp.]